MKSLYTSAFLIFCICSIAWAQKPCPGVPTVNYAGKLYHTVKIGSQCWLKENLNVGVMIDSTKNQTNNHSIEKYCYRNDPANCTKFGGLYQWNEALQYASGTSKIKGICPPGWHLPDTTDFKKLILAVKMDGKSLKALGQAKGAGAGSNTSGFSALFSGSRGLKGAFFGLNQYTYLWASSMANSLDASDLYLDNSDNRIYQSDSQIDYGLSVRCIKN